MTPPVEETVANLTATVDGLQAEISELRRKVARPVRIGRLLPPTEETAIAVAAVVIIATWLLMRRRT